jgi:hypothetical protein
VKTLGEATAEVETIGLRIKLTTPQDALVAEPKGLEEELPVPHVPKSTRLTELLADNFIGFGSSDRIYTKNDLVAVLQAESRVTQTTSVFHQATITPTP